MWTFDLSQVVLYIIALCGICIVLFLAFIPMKSIRVKGLIVLVAYLAMALIAAFTSATIKTGDVSVLLVRAIVFEGFPSLIALLTSLLTFINAKLDTQKETP